MIRNMNDHKVLFGFDDERDVNQILMNQPWSFDKHLVVVMRYEKDVPLKSLSFNMVMLWVQVHDIPIRYMTTEVAEKLCDIIGEVVKSIGAETKERSCFMRVRVKVDIAEPSYRRRLITLENGEKTWVVFKYKRLPNFCFWCGRLSYGDRDCSLWLQSKGTLKEEDRQFGPSLIAAPYNPTNQRVIYVSGF